MVHSHRAGDTFEAERDDEIEQWLKHGYVEEVKKSLILTKDQTAD